MDATTDSNAYMPEGVYTRAARHEAEKHGVRDRCAYLNQVRHLFSHRLSCIAAACDTCIDRHTAHSLCLTRRHHECSIFKAHEAERRRQHGVRVRCGV